MLSLTAESIEPASDGTDTVNTSFLHHDETLLAYKILARRFKMKDVYPDNYYNNKTLIVCVYNSLVQT